MENKNLQISSDPESLTSFGEPKEESSSSATGFFKYVLDLFSNKKDGKNTGETSQASNQIATNRPNVLNLTESGKSKRKSLDRPVLPNPAGSEVEIRLRSFSSFLKDFPKLVRGSQSPDSDDNQPLTTSPALNAEELRQYWMPDEQCHECYECGEKFTTFRRRHHCRICGQIFCSRCCNQLISGKIMGLNGMLRSCMYCCRLVLRFAEGNKTEITKAISQSLSVSRSNSAQDELLYENNSTENLSAVQSQSGMYDQLFNNSSIRQQNQSSLNQSLDSSFSDDQLFNAGPSNGLGILSPVMEQLVMPSPKFIFDATQVESTPQSIFGSDIKNDLVKDSFQLHLIWRNVCDEQDGIEFRDHRFRLRKYSNCITGQELVDWLIKNDLASDRTQGCAIGQALCEGQWMKSVLDVGGLFQDGYVLFQNNRSTSTSSLNRIEIFPDHFAVSNNHDGATLQNLTEREPPWVQEIKCNGEDEIDGCLVDASESELAWSDGHSSIPNDMLLYSDEEQSISGRSVISLSSYVEIDEGDEVIKYTRSSSLEKPEANKQLKNLTAMHPTYDDASTTQISADYLRSFIAWNGTYLNHPFHRASSGWRESDLQLKTSESCDKRAFHWLREMYLRHNLAFLRQLLSEKRLDLAWAKILFPLAQHASFHISPDPNVSMDICHYVQIKKVPDGVRRESHVINGVAFTKNVVNKNMKTDILNPAILLLAIPLEYERVQLKLSALDPVVRQEREFYKHLITRVASRHPDVVLAQCTVSRIAQELLLEAGITVIVNVKPSVMERVARSTEGDIVYSIDQLLQAKLGSCSRFFLKKHVFYNCDLAKDHISKTLLYFDGCKPIHGCTVILREQNLNYDGLGDLAKVKDVFRFLLRAMFHVRLELSYLIDQHNFGKLLKKYGSCKGLRSDSEVTLKSLEDNTILNNTLLPQSARSSSSYSSIPEVSATSKTLNSSATSDLLPPSGSSTIPYAPSKSELFDKALHAVLLSTSPLIQPSKPYLCTEQGQSSPNCKFLPLKIFHFRPHDLEGAGVQEPIAHSFHHKANAPSKPNAVEPSGQDKPWLSHSQGKLTKDSVIRKHSPTPDDNCKNQQTSKEMLNDDSHMNSNQMQTPPISHYSQQYLQNKSEDSTGIDAALSSTKQTTLSRGMQTWEQTIIDMIFGPSANGNVQKKALLSSSETLTINDDSHSYSNMKSYKKIDGKCVNNRTILPSLNDESLHEFISFSFTQSASSEEVRDLLSNFRAHAGSLFHQVNHDETESPVDEEVQDSEECGSTALLESVSRRNIDSLDPYNHQHISVLFSSYSMQSPNAPHFCVLPWVVNIDFYRGNDITLGGFLERYCFRPSYHCPNAACRRPMVEHVRSFVYGNMCMSVLLKELSKPFQQSSILTWTWDHVTKLPSSIKTMSHDAWFMSFAKYLELNLGPLSIPEMGSLPYQQQGIVKQDVFDEHWELKPFHGFQYFLFRDLVAAFKCFPISLHEILFPSVSLPRPNEEDTVTYHNVSNGCYDDVITVNDAFYISKLLAERIETTSEDIEGCIHSSQNRKGTADTNSEEIPLSREKYFLELLSSLNDEKSSLLEHVDEMVWLLKGHGFSQSENTDYFFVDAFESHKSDVFEPLLADNLRNKISLHILRLKHDISKMVQVWNQKLADAYNKDITSYWNPSKSKQASSPQSQRKRIHTIVQEETDTLNECSDADVEFPGSVSFPPTATALSRNHFDDISGSSDADPAEDVSGIKTIRRLKRGISVDAKVHEKSVKRPTRTGSSVKSMVTRLLLAKPTCPMPFPADEHYLLPECLHTGIIVRDAEPSSIIAYTLCSSEYKKAVKHENSTSDTLIANDSPKYTVHDSEHYQKESERLTNKPNSVLDNSSHENPMLKETGSHQESIPTAASCDHIEVQFSDSTTRFYCKVYFAKLFQKFRERILGGGENQYLVSLSRSMKWLARGGKSGSTFHKTKDDQFILKQMSHFEMQSFLEFAPKYVSYITECIDSNKVTAISKILGVYRISFHNSETGRSLKQDVLVIENLFYRKKIDRIFDLKGSVRNRHVKPATKETTESSSKKEDIVLLDENLLKIMCENPIYIHEHTKFLLNSAIRRDAEFLSKNLIMDYSLLIGIDKDNQIFIGIIDFIRTFTWDKKLEMVVKWSSSRSMPTVVSPELYKNRFCDAMDRYFLVVPDRWYGMHLFDDAS